MGKVFLRETVLIILTGLAAWLLVPAMLGQPPAAPLFLVGVVMGLTFAPTYGVALLGGRKMPTWVQTALGVLAWFFTFWTDIMMVVSRLAAGVVNTPVVLYMRLAPGLFGLLLALMGALRADRGRRVRGAAGALYAYAFSMLIVRWALVPMVSINLVLATIAMQCGALYMLAHGLLRLYAPVSVETDGPASEPLMRRRAVPDAVVGLAEGTLRRRARPYATAPGGGMDETAISLLVPHEEVEGALQKLTGALEGKPFDAVAGERLGREVEVVVRPRP
ncbi:MAG TPA: hypothetical protein VK464_16780 [Symbiobacteriaceae bacterium]|jgi:hypothetical protein|nr:hypothetical protein [Symbiobacteriaceae bacterium]